MKKLLGLAAAIALFATGANAAPVTLTDSVMDNVTAGYKCGYCSTNTAYADASAYAKAFGKKTYADAYTYTYAIVTPFSSEAGSGSYSYASTY